MLDSVLAWIRRGLAVGILAAMLLPLVTVKGCEAGAPKITYTGWALVWEAPTLVSIPLFAVAAAGLTFVSRRVRSAVGRHILALLKTFFAGAAGIWTFWAFAIWSATMTVWTEIGIWLILGAGLGIVACDLVEAGAAWVAWRRWKRSKTIPVLEDPLVRFTGRGCITLGPVLIAIVVLGTALRFAIYQEWPPAFLWLFIGGALLFFAAWGTLASLAGWGIRRGLGWARGLTRVGAWATTLLAGALLYLTLSLMTQDFNRWERLRFDQADEDLLWGWAAIAFLLAWLAWTWWTVRVVLGWRQRLFPSRRARLETAAGRLRVRVPRCPECRARLWLSLDGVQLVCRSCGTTFAAAIPARRDSAKCD
jgi:hypothetical protein